MNKQQSIGSKALLQEVIDLMIEAKAEEISTIHTNSSPFFEYVVVATGNVGRHLSAVADKVVEKFLSYGIVVSIEGKAKGDWVLVDAGDIIVHIMNKSARQEVALESLWAKAKPEC